MPKLFISSPPSQYPQSAIEPSMCFNVALTFLHPLFKRRDASAAGCKLMPARQHFRPYFHLPNMTMLFRLYWNKYTLTCPDNQDPEAPGICSETGTSYSLSQKERSVGVPRDNTVKNGWICAPAALLSLRVRHVRVVQVPCRDTNQLIFDSATSALGNSPVFKADDGGVLNVR